MINKEEIEKIKLELQIIVETVREIFHLKVKEDDEDVYEIDGRQFLAIEKALEYISGLEEENKKQTELNAQHQKLNGELQKKLTEYEKQLDLDYVEENYVKKSVFLNLLKENGELKDRLIIAEEICKGKSIQELGMSDLYKED